jgi:hypothetical protein
MQAKGFQMTKELIGSGAKVEWHQNDDAFDVHCLHRLQESMRTS